VSVSDLHDPFPVHVCPPPLQLDEWLVTNLPEGSRVGLDPFCHTVDSLHKLKDKLEVRGPLLLAVF
jgi:hypothetical protein